MLDIKFIRENAGLVKDAARKKHIEIDIDHLLEIDQERRKLQRDVEEKRASQNAVTQRISETTDTDQKVKLIGEMQMFKAGLHVGEKKLKELMQEWQTLMVQVPNVPDMSVPEGESDEDNKEVSVWGEKPSFTFAPKSHVEIAKLYDMADFERGVKVAGFRGYFLKNDGARLAFAVLNFVRNEFEKKKDFIPTFAPSLLRREPFIGTGYLPQSEEDLYKTQDNEYLAGTSEVASMGYYMDEVLDKKDLPVKFLAFSTCFRREAGSHGKDTKGLMRVHEFFKLEQIVLCEANHEESVKHHEDLTRNSEDLLQALKLPYRKVINCGGDLGLGQVKKYDLEVWVPSEGKFRETHSSSYFHDFQTRRLNIRYKDEDGVLRYAHSLNNTAIATPRVLISILENNQQEDGSIVVPEVLRPYMGKDVIATNTQ